MNLHGLVTIGLNVLTHARTVNDVLLDLSQEMSVAIETSYKQIRLHHHADSYHWLSLNSLAPGRFKVNFRWVIFKLILVLDGWCISCETALIWMSLDHTYDKSTLVQVMAWCRQATSHYLSQCWPTSQSPYDVTRPQWVEATEWLNPRYHYWSLYIEHPLL